MNEPLTPEQVKALAAPFPVVHWLIVAEGKNGKDDLWAAYLDRTDIQNRLDDVVGVSGWSFAIEPIPETECVMGRLSLGGVSKSDIGDGKGSDEPLKAATTDALKRAATHFGIGRHLPDRQFLAKGKKPATRAAPTARPRPAPKPAAPTPAPENVVPFEPDAERTWANKLHELQVEAGITIDEIVELLKIEAGPSPDAAASFRKYVATVAARKQITTEDVYHLIYDDLATALHEKGLP